jgi:prepilin-type processing-associated H-X9-DG protein
MYCPKCGAQNPDAAQICSSCGAVLTPPVAQPPLTPAKTSGMAIASLILAILSPFTCFISAIPAIILGIVSLVKISQSRDQLKGVGLAVTGIALPVALVPFVACLMGILMPALARTRQIAFRMHCAANLNQIGCMMLMYANDNEGKFPAADRRCDLLIEHEGAKRSTFHCKGSASPQHTCTYAMNKNIENFDKESKAPPDMVLIFESKPGWNQSGGPEMLTTDNHQGDGCNILFVDCHVEFIKKQNLDELKW